MKIGEQCPACGYTHERPAVCICGAPLPQNDNETRPRLYCSVKCRQRASRRRLAHAYWREQEKVA